MRKITHKYTIGLFAALAGLAILFLTKFIDSSFIAFIVGLYGSVIALAGGVLLILDAYTNRKEKK